MFIQGADGGLKFAESFYSWRTIQQGFRLSWDMMLGLAGRHEPYRSLGVAVPPWNRVEANGAFELGRDGLVYAAKDLYGAMLLMLLSLRENARHCKKPGCDVTPYFLADHKRQEYCSESCAAWGQKQAKLKWWAESGPDWQRTKRTGTAEKPTKGKKNVTHKAR
jgi:hypothetical protein